LGSSAGNRLTYENFTDILLPWVMQEQIKTWILFLYLARAWTADKLRSGAYRIAIDTLTNQSVKN
jgi:hypothetical protein